MKTPEYETSPSEVRTFALLQLGLTTVCVEMDRTLGGTCVNVGCIPSKALLQSSEHFEFARTHAAEHGLVVGEVALDLARMLKRKDDVVGQNTRLFSIGDTLVYEAHPGNQARTEFRATRVTANELVFENPAHDFPQRVMYSVGTGGSLNARIEGTINGQPRGVDFSFKRAKCGGE